MATLENSCSACYKAQAPECCPYYLIGGLTPGTEYHVSARDSRGRVYEIDADGELVDSNGNLKIIFPEGVNTSANGVMTIQLFLGTDLAQHLNLCKPQDFTTCDGTFNCIELSFYKTEGGHPDFWEILCLCPEEPICEGMCGVPENDAAITEFVGLCDDVSFVPEVNGAYLVNGTKAIIVCNDSRILEIAACCQGIAAFYPTDGSGTGPFQFNEESGNWESIITYQPIGWDFGVSFTIGGLIPDFATGVLQVTQDNGATWGTLGTKFTKEELSEGVTRLTALTYFWSRILVTLPNGCSYPSAVNTSTD